MRVFVPRAVQCQRLAVVVALSGVLTGCSRQGAVQTFQFQGGQLRGGVIDYSLSPPPGGPYSPLWQRCMAYARPLLPEYAVHSLARGAVWLTYRPDLAPSDTAALKALSSENPQVLLSPLPTQSVAVVATAWNAQRQFDSLDERGLRQFVGHYAARSDVPEAGQGCADGQTDTQ